MLIFFIKLINTIKGNYKKIIQLMEIKLFFVSVIHNFFSSREKKI